MTTQPEKLGTRPTPACSPGGVDAFMVVRNEMERLPDILDHHRRLGVERFFITDNASEDGTAAYLLRQPDCCTHYTTDSFRDAGCGMDWINELVRRHGQDRWCLFIDADELFVYPHADTVSLPDFCRFLAATGAQGVFAIMVDMYSPGPIGEARYRPGTRLVEACPLYDTDYRLRRKLTSPFSPSFQNVEAHGGPRHRVFYPEFSDKGLLGTTLARALRVLRHSRLGGALGLERTSLGIYPPEITKIPLIHAGPDRYWATNHRSTPLAIAPVTGALLHFKLLSSFSERAYTEIRRKEHWGGATEYARYAALLEQQADIRFVYEGSRRYHAPDDLLRDGIIRSSRAFDDYASTWREEESGLPQAAMGPSPPAGGVPA
ncbi:hypothetical protein FHS82_001880 [Pseudochelatococcus lubricantis]|uniref:Glycosyltransferase family 2 protein n=1 Tax=Pseudochelatococcus lubricantis TaxID=1538102 RepID=A0ABX0V1Q1_9HYPH|nr:glycosyltransferase family 2 protein [Pseudochelatococcus lubricantis]NIJ58044.1 hypothetical protein [Pseudochelatococcus lubricantis]